MKKWRTSKQTTVWKLLSLRCNCYVLEKNHKFILVDTSMGFDRYLIRLQLKRIGARTLDAIYITHVHKDHVGNAAYFQKKFECPVYVDQLEYNFMVKGFSEVPKGTSRYTRCLTKIMDRKNFFIQFEPAKFVKVFKDKCHMEELKENLSFIRLAGHTRGSISIIIDDEIALVGDTMSYRGDTIYPSFADCKEELKQSWQKLLCLRCLIYLPGHGKQITRKDINKSLCNLKNNLIF